MKTHKVLPLALLFISLCLFNTVYADKVLEYKSTESTKKVAVPNTSPKFEIELDFPEAFQISIDAFNGKTGQKGFCETYPSMITSKLQWTDTFEETPGKTHRYDSIAYYKGLFFILDSINLDILVAHDVKKVEDYLTIESEFQNEPVGDQYEEPFLMVDQPNNILYVITTKALLYYQLDPLMTAIVHKTQVPKLSKSASGYKKYESILSVQHYHHRLYIVADNNVAVYKVDSTGEVTVHETFDAKFFKVKEVAIVDIAFKGKYAFVLDSLNGLFVVDLTNQDGIMSDMDINYRYVERLSTVKVTKGQFIEIIGDSLNIVSSTSKNSFIQEYILNGDADISEITFNRKIDLFQSVRDTYSDGNFLYILTGFFNIVAKHSVPVRFNNADVADYLTEYWPLFGAKAMVAVKTNSTSRVVAIQDDYITLLKFQQDNPFLSCDTNKTDEGSYSFDISVIQNDCDAKRNNPDTSDFNSVCKVSETIELIITKDGSTIGNMALGNQRITLLMIGLGFTATLVIIFCCLFRKYWKQYRRLQDQIKFHRLEEISDGKEIVDIRKRTSSLPELNPAAVQGGK